MTATHIGTRVVMNLMDLIHGIGAALASCERINKGARQRRAQFRSSSSASAFVIRQPLRDT